MGQLCIQAFPLGRIELTKLGYSACECVTPPLPHWPGAAHICEHAFRTRPVLFSPVRASCVSRMRRGICHEGACHPNRLRAGKKRTGRGARARIATTSRQLHRPDLDRVAAHIYLSAEKLGQAHRRGHYPHKRPTRGIGLPSSGALRLRRSEAEREIRAWIRSKTVVPQFEEAGSWTKAD
jgi:hypothetical protein